MGLSTEQREFRSREGYDQFFQEVRAEGPNHLAMFVKPEGGGRAKLMKTYVTHPDLDFKLLDFVISEPSYTGRWSIRPVENLQEYRDRTDKRGYRVRLRKQQVVDYRRFMTKEGVFMPFLVFDLERKLWISGRHRSEAGKNDFEAMFALVLEGLTDEESLFITDITNQWHQESWDPDEAALLALQYMIVQGVSEKKALVTQNLDPTNTSPLLGAMLYRWHNQNPNDRRLIESGKDGHGHPFSLKTLGDRVRVFGKDSIQTFPIERWIYLNEPETNQAFGLLRSRTGSTARGDYVSNFDRKDWALKGDAEARWMEFLEIVQEVKRVNATKAAGVSGPTDDRIWASFMLKFATMSPANLIEIKKAQTDLALEKTEEFVRTLARIYGI